jgi:hypothetical protein
LPIAIFAIAIFIDIIFSHIAGFHIDYADTPAIFFRFSHYYADATLFASRHY